MAKGYTFSDRFPKAKLFLFLAVLLALPLTVLSLQNARTNTQQNAATAVTTCTAKGGACYPNYGNCPPGSNLISGTCGVNLDSKCCSKELCGGKPYVQVWDQGNYAGRTNVWCADLIMTKAGGFYNVYSKNVGDILNDNIYSIKLVHWTGNNSYNISFYYGENYTRGLFFVLKSGSSYDSPTSVPSVPELFYKLTGKGMPVNEGITSFKVTSHP